MGWGEEVSSPPTRRPPLHPAAPAPPTSPHRILHIPPVPWGGCGGSAGGGYLHSCLSAEDGWTNALGWQRRHGQRGASLSVTAVHAGRLNLVANRRDQGWAPRIVPQLPGMGGIRMPEGLAEGEMDGRGGEGRLGTRRQRGFTPSEERFPRLRANQAARS